MPNKSTHFILRQRALGYLEESIFIYKIGDLFAYKINSGRGRMYKIIGVNIINIPASFFILGSLVDIY